jgi:hypothetical protein
MNKTKFNPWNKEGTKSLQAITLIKYLKNVNDDESVEDSVADNLEYYSDYSYCMEVLRNTADYTTKVLAHCLNAYATEMVKHIDNFGENLENLEKALDKEFKASLDKKINSISNKMNFIQEEFDILYEKLKTHLDVDSFAVEALNNDYDNYEKLEIISEILSSSFENKRKVIIDAIDSIDAI